MRPNRHANSNNNGLPMRFLVSIFTLSFLAVVSVGAKAAVLELAEVNDRVYAIIGPMEQRNADNLANNATFGFVVTDAGVVLVDPGGSFKGAKQIHKIVQSVTDKPIAYVINTGGQDHRWLGNGYFKALGATIIASACQDRDRLCLRMLPTPSCRSMRPTLDHLPSVHVSQIPSAVTLHRK